MVIHRAIKKATDFEIPSHKDSSLEQQIETSGRKLSVSQAPSKGEPDEYKSDEMELLISNLIEILYNPSGTASEKLKSIKSKRQQTDVL